MCSFALLSS
uniref:Uncharacterized protein n=1 Tax=Arundo donax TaxID=35708 RepID=A0A0A9AW48_ARUDO